MSNEEVGLRGAHASTTKFDPEVFLAVDCSPAGDVYGGQGKIGDGTLIRFYDPGHLLLPGMKDFLLTTAEEAGIKYQYYCGKGGTDAGAAHLKNGGVPSTTIGVCARYIHSHQTLYAMDDFLEAQAFLQALVKKIGSFYSRFNQKLLNRNDGGDRYGRIKPRNLDTGSLQ